MEGSDARQHAATALARDIVERRTGMPAYLVDDETWEAAEAEAEALYVSPQVHPPTILQEAVRKAQGNRHTAEEIKESINFLNRVAARMKKR